MFISDFDIILKFLKSTLEQNLYCAAHVIIKQLFEPDETINIFIVDFQEYIAFFNKMI